MKSQKVHIAAILLLAPLAYVLLSISGKMQRAIQELKNLLYMPWRIPFRGESQLGRV